MHSEICHMRSKDIDSKFQEPVQESTCTYYVQSGPRHWHEEENLPTHTFRGHD